MVLAYRYWLVVLVLVAIFVLGLVTLLLPIFVLPTTLMVAGFPVLSVLALLPMLPFHLAMLLLISFALWRFH